MAANTSEFKSDSSIKAFFDLIYEIKFSRHVPLTVILLFGFYAVWRSNHYISETIHLSLYVSLPLSISIELAMFACGAMCFIALRENYIRELNKIDVGRGSIGIYASYGSLLIMTVALLFIAGADGALESNHDPVFMLFMILIQLIQSILVIVFLNIADLDERDKLRKQFAQQQKNQQVSNAIWTANHCPHCLQRVPSKNRKRHINSCAANPNRSN